MAKKSTTPKKRRGSKKGASKKGASQKRTTQQRKKGTQKTASKKGTSKKGASKKGASKKETVPQAKPNPNHWRDMAPHERELAEKYSEGILDYTFYMIQRGESGFQNGCRNRVYLDSRKVPTIGYGTAIGKKYNDVSIPKSRVVDEKWSVAAAKSVLKEKLATCRRVFKGFDRMLPCYKSVLLDMMYQGVASGTNPILARGTREDLFVKATTAGDRYGINHERKAVRGRGIRMGIWIEEEIKKNGLGVDPKQVAERLAQRLISEKPCVTDKIETNITKDELALLYRSCMFAYGKKTTEKEIIEFAEKYGASLPSGVSCIGHALYQKPEDLDGELVCPRLVRRLGRGGTLRVKSISKDGRVVFKEVPKQDRLSSRLAEAREAQTPALTTHLSACSQSVEVVESSKTRSMPSDPKSRD